ncbi:MAG: DUF4982 domain-containing protein [Treponemataceae bacterium]|nr:DUF4982 domain-containing protein [Treponemataceae bacterium]
MERLFNDNWQFAKIHLDSADTNLPDFENLINDKTLTYNPVSIPHDWLIWNTKDLYENSIGIYKKTFNISEKNYIDGSRYYLRFEAVYMDTTVFINGKKAFVWKYGYTTFEVDASPFIKDGENTIHVISVYRSPNTRWYSGAGIYRNVWLKILPQTHIVADGLYVSNKKEKLAIEAQSEEWKCFYQVELVSHVKPAEVTVKAKLLSADGKEKAFEEKSLLVQAADTSTDMYYFLKAEHCVPEKESPGYAEIPPGTTGAAPGLAVCSGTFHLKDIRLWDIADPYLYTLVIELCDKDGKLLDTKKQKIGFRTIEYNSDKGFFLNGRHVKIHGACLHHDLGCLGSAFNKAALKRQFKKMFEMGVNSIRTSHNPPAPDFLDLADEMGMLINCECFDQWERSKTKYDYGNYFKEYHSIDVASWIRRDRNHPSIIMWSIGNEIYDTHLGTGLAIAKKLTSLVHTYDFCMNAPVTIGSNYIEWENAQDCMKEVDLAGYNYAERLYEEHHKKYPDWKIYGSETSSTVQSRGIYHFPAEFRTLTHDDQQCSCLGNCSSNWGSINTTMAIVPDRDAEFCLGQYIWTGWDYIGEPTPYFTKNSYFGQVDTAGFKKDTFYLYQAEWTDYHDKPMVHLLPYWDFNENQIIDVKAYTNAPCVELFFNDESLGKEEIDHKKGRILEGHWKVPYKNGKIVALAYDERGNKIAEDSKSSFGDPAKIELFYEQEDDLLFVDIQTKDKKGIPVENARNRVYVSVKGGQLLGLDNGDSTDYEQYKCSSRKLFNNHLLAIIRLPAEGNIEIRVESPGLDKVSELYSVKAWKKEEDYEFRTKPLCSEERVESGLSDIPVRKIELIPAGSLCLDKSNPSVIVKARILPENATYSELEWKPCRIEGVQTSCAKVELMEDGLSVRLSAAGDGDFRLRCTAGNGKSHPDVVSEIEFTIKDFGSGTFNPYSLISACECTSSLQEPKQSFQGGVYVLAERNWLSFDNVDFGPDGSDEFSIPIFSFDPELPLELWDGNPDEGGKKLMSFMYKAQSWYNHYQSNTWKLPTRLTGIHSISIVTTTRLSIQGIQFIKSSKAFSRLNAVDADRITGDSFTREKDYIKGIGNNVSLEFHNMNFGETGTSRIKIEGQSINGTNTVHIKFSSSKSIAEIPQTESITEQEFSLGETIKGLQDVTFIFLPGSCFDFKSFTFIPQQ